MERKNGEGLKGGASGEEVRLLRGSAGSYLPSLPKIEILLKDPNLVDEERVWRG